MSTNDRFFVMFIIGAVFGVSLIGLIVGLMPDEPNVLLALISAGFAVISFSGGLYASLAFESADPA